MLHKSLLGLLLAPFLVLLAGCCANNPCDCNDSLADSLFFAFDKSTFSPTELDTVYVSRTVRPSLSNPNPSSVPETLPLPWKSRVPTTLTAQINFNKQDTTGLVVISNNAPFSQSSTSTNLSGYNYTFRIQKDAPKGTPVSYYTYVVSNITLVGSYLADGCCTCYRNSRKLATVTGGSNTGLNLTVTDSLANSSGRRIPRVITLRK